MSPEQDSREETKGETWGGGRACGVGRECQSREGRVDEEGEYGVGRECQSREGRIVGGRAVPRRRSS